MSMAVCIRLRRLAFITQKQCSFSQTLMALKNIYFRTLQALLQHLLAYIYQLSLQQRLPRSLLSMALCKVPCTVEAYSLVSSSAIKLSEQNLKPDSSRGLGYQSDTKKIAFSLQFMCKARALYNSFQQELTLNNLLSQLPLLSQITMSRKSLKPGESGLLPCWRVNLRREGEMRQEGRPLRNQKSQGGFFFNYSQLILVNLMYANLTNKLLKDVVFHYEPINSLAAPLRHCHYFQQRYLLASQDCVHILGSDMKVIEERHQANQLACLTKKSVLTANNNLLSYYPSNTQETSGRISFLKADQHDIAVVGIQSYEIRVYGLQLFNMLRSYTSQDVVNAMDWSNSLLASAGQYVSFWDIQNGLVAKRVTFQDEMISSVKISCRPGDQNFIIVLGSQGTAGLIDARNNSLAGAPKLTPSKPTPHILVNNSNFLIVYSKREITVFDLVAFRVQVRFFADSDIVRADLFNNMIIAMLKTGALQLFDIDSAKPLWKKSVGQRGEGVWQVQNRLMIGVDGTYGQLLSK